MNRLIVQGLLQMLAVFIPEVWRFFAIGCAPPASTPSEMVVAHALRHTFPHFLLSLPPTDALTKFLAPRLDPQRCPTLCLFPLEQAA